MYNHLYKRESKPRPIFEDMAELQSFITQKNPKGSSWAGPPAAMLNKHPGRAASERPQTPHRASGPETVRGKLGREIIQSLFPTNNHVLTEARQYSIVEDESSHPTPPPHRQKSVVSSSQHSKLSSRLSPYKIPGQLKIVNKASLKLFTPTPLQLLQATHLSMEQGSGHQGHLGQNCQTRHQVSHKSLATELSFLLPFSLPTVHNLLAQSNATFSFNCAFNEPESPLTSKIFISGCASTPDPSGTTIWFIFFFKKKKI